ncbi:hypothetical protein LXL04_004167 [Taraxacum kok-saghyz]
MGELRHEGPSTSHGTNLITPSQFNNADQLLDMEESGLSMTTSINSAIMINPAVPNDLHHLNWSRASLAIEYGTGSISGTIIFP